MEPKRELGDDRTMWRARPLMTSTRRDGGIEPIGGWAYSETSSGAMELLELGGGSIEVECVTVTAEQWNAMPEFEGW